MTHSPNGGDDTENDDCCWPDPGPSRRARASEVGDGAARDRRPRINDVSRMSDHPDGTLVARILFPRCEGDVVCILRAARDAGKSVGVRGTKHSMGGHSVVAGRSGWEIDTRLLRHLEYDVGRPDVVRCGPGCRWSDVIRVLNAHGRSPRTMQSYCSFSVGGTLAVNAHGVTTDYCFAESVVEMRLACVSAEGRVEIVECKPPAGDGQKSRGEELFGLALGGYGLFGVITEVVLKVDVNVKLQLDSMQLSVNGSSDGGSSEFSRIYDSCRNAKDSQGTSLGRVDIKLARLNTVTLDRASLYVLRAAAPPGAAAAVGHVSDLPASPRELSPASRLLYKWALPLLKERRYAQEENTGKAIDWGDEGDSLTRNQLLYESAVPLSKLYEPLLKKDDTFILQEFFCPHARMTEWLEAVRPIYKEIQEEQYKHGQDIILLNTTIRFVEKDDITFLSYSRVPMFAFVLYYRIKRDVEVEKRLGDFHNRFAEATIGLGGTFYLPYRCCYSAKLLKAAYPMIEDFAKKKEQYDPDCLFSNLWFERYILPLCSEGYQQRWSLAHEHDSGFDFTIAERILPKIHEAKTKLEFLEWLPRKDHPLMLKRTNSYRSLIRSKELSDQFREQFLVRIFNLADPGEVMRVMARAAWDPANDDIQIYSVIHRHFHGTSGQGKQDLSKILPRYWRALNQLRQQKEELTRQTLSILMRLGKLGDLNDYVCIGDHGKTVVSFVEKMQMAGTIWVVHDSEDVVDKHMENKKSLPSLNTVLERGSLEPVAHEEILYNYCLDSAQEKFERIPTNAVDLVTMNQGLHHIPLDNLFEFLVEVKRILRPDGIFIIREHDLQMISNDDNSDIGKVPYPMLDLAHSIFNAVTGVPVKAETAEIRAFRPIMEWRAILAKVGFIDTLVSDVEDGDPTWDEMLAFSLPSESIQQTISPSNKESHKMINHKDPPILPLIRTVLGQIPASAATTAETILSSIQLWLPSVSKYLRNDVLSEIPKILKELKIDGTSAGLAANQASVGLEMKLVATINEVARVVDGALSLLSQSEIKKFYNFKNLVNTPELFLLLPYLERKVEIEGDDCNEAEKMLVIFCRNHFPLLLFDEQNKEDCVRECSHGHPVKSDCDFVSGEVTAVEVQTVIEKLADSIPGLLDPDILLVQSGFTVTQQSSLIAKFGGTDVPSFSRNIVGFLDRPTFEVLEAKLRIVERTGELPTRNRLFSSSESHPWHSVMKTFMKSPKVVLEHRAIFGLKMIGLGEVESLYKAAKQEQLDGPDEQLQFGSEVVSYLHSLDQTLEDLGQKWTKNNIIERKITFDGSAETSLYDVAEVLSARFGYTSVTSRKVDVTRELQELHSRSHAKIANPDGGQHDIPPLGWLPINEDILVQMRFRGNTKKEVGDGLRKRLVKSASLGLAGNNQLIIKYRRIVLDERRSQRFDNHDPVPDNAVNNVLRCGLVENIATACESLGKFLESKGLVQKDLHPSDGHYTFFKLNEWMQVEILEELVDSLSHTPWYRFPFMPFLRTYFEVFRRQCHIVQRKFGTLVAYTSEAFFVDLIPGIVMTLLFGQLQLLAVPLKMMTPPDGYAGLDQSKFLEEIILHVKLPRLGDELRFFKTEVDANILRVRVLPGNFVIISTPPFKAMGEALIRVAKRFPTARVFQISNQREVQVRISRSCSDGMGMDGIDERDEDLERISALPRVERLMQYQFPNTNLSGGTTETNKMKRNYCFQVHCLSLLDVIRTCSLLPALEVEQIYDFWN